MPSHSTSDRKRVHLGVQFKDEHPHFRRGECTYIIASAVRYKFEFKRERTMDVCIREIASVGSFFEACST